MSGVLRGDIGIFINSQYTLGSFILLLLLLSSDWYGSPYNIFHIRTEYSMQCVYLYAYVEGTTLLYSEVNMYNLLWFNKYFFYNREKTKK